jgi:hypothetical protein
VRKGFRSCPSIGQVFHIEWPDLRGLFEPVAEVRWLEAAVARLIFGRTRTVQNSS